MFSLLLCLNPRAVLGSMSSLVFAASLVGLLLTAPGQAQSRHQRPDPAPQPAALLAQGTPGGRATPTTRPAPTKAPARPTARATTAPPTAATPAPDGTANAEGTLGITPTPNPSAAPGNTLDAVVAAVSVGETEGTITLNAPGGRLNTIAVPATVSVVRDGQPADLTAIEATDRVTIQRDAANKVLGIIAVSVPPTAGPTTSASPQATGVASPEASVTTTAGPAGTPDTSIRGAVSSVDNGAITVLGDDGASQTVDTRTTPNIAVTRDGGNAAVTDIRQGDRVIITRDAAGQPAQITATSTETSAQGLDPRWLWYLPLLLVPFLLLLLPLARRRRVPFAVQRREP